MTTEASGARTANESTHAEVAQNVQAMFNNIAPRYDLLNHLLSMGLDRLWWRRTAHVFAPILKNPEAQIVDLCCGTGDQTIALHNARPANATAIIGLDFSSQMLARARQKFATENITWLEGDAMHLPFADDSIDLVTCAFGFRNLPDYAAGLREISRVLKPGGQVGILEANQPSGLRAAVFNLYFHHIAPIIGGMISGDRKAYVYLPESVARFPRPATMLGMLRDAGFTNQRWDGYMLHSAGLYVATKT